MNTDKFLKKALYSFLLVFSFMCISGVVIIFISFPNTESNHGNQWTDIQDK
jgi:hypothetical protein